jgi:hypothetical protein
MGAWGPGIFDDDAAYDFVEILQDTDDPIEVFTSSFETAIAADYLDYDDAHAATVSAAYMDAILNGTTYESENQEALHSFKEEKKNLPVQPLKSLAVKALQKVISDQSELHQLWQENEELYPQWKQNIQSLIGRLR